MRPRATAGGAPRRSCWAARSSATAVRDRASPRVRAMASVHACRRRRIAGVERRDLGEVEGVVPSQRPDPAKAAHVDRGAGRAVGERRFRCHRLVLSQSPANHVKTTLVGHHEAISLQCERPAYAKASARSRRSASRGGGSAPTKRRARERVRESEGRSPSVKIRRISCVRGFRVRENHAKFCSRVVRVVRGFAPVRSTVTDQRRLDRFCASSGVWPLPGAASNRCRRAWPRFQNLRAHARSARRGQSLPS